jgi:ABC-type Fe3+-siderophore transport system permease subunit
MAMHLRNRSWYVIPIVGVVLSLPTLLSCLVLVALVYYEVIIRDMRGTLVLSVLNLLRPSLAPLLLYIVFGPIFTCILCTLQLSWVAQDASLAATAGSNVQRITRMVLFLAAIALCVLILTGGVARIIRGPT